MDLSLYWHRLWPRVRVPWRTNRRGISLIAASTKAGGQSRKPNLLLSGCSPDQAEPRISAWYYLVGVFTITPLFKSKSYSAG